MCIGGLAEKELMHSNVSASFCDSSLKIEVLVFAVTRSANQPCLFSALPQLLLFMWLLCGDWSVNREACLWQSYLPCSMLLGVRQPGIKARGKRRPVTGTKEFQGPHWKCILIRVAAPASLPLFPTRPPSPGPHWATPFPLVLCGVTVAL